VASIIRIDDRGSRCPCRHHNFKRQCHYIHHNKNLKYQKIIRPTVCWLTGVDNFNQTGNVHINLTLRNGHGTIIAGENQ